MYTSRKINRFHVHRYIHVRKIDINFKVDTEYIHTSYFLIRFFEDQVLIWL